MRGLLQALTQKPDPQSPISRIGNRFGLSYSIRRPSVKAGLLVAGMALALLFGLDYAGVKVPAIASGLFGGYEVGMSGVLMAGVGSFFDRLSKKQSDNSRPSFTMMQSVVKSNAAWFVVKSGLQPGTVLDIDTDKAVIGSGADSEIRVEHESVSESHALIKVVDGAYILSDPGTRTGTWVNDKLQSGMVLKDESEVRVGTTLITFYPTVRNVKKADSEEPQIVKGTLFVKAGTNIGESFQGGMGDIVIGSDPGESGIELDDRAVSKRHATIRVMSRVCRLYHLGSTNGTDVDGRNVGGVALNDGDVIKLGKIEVRFVRESVMWSWLILRIQ